MDEQVLKDSMQLIYYSGNAKSKAMESIMCAEQGNLELARSKLLEARNELVQSHQIQTTMMQEEMNGKKIEKSILLIHSQDHFMSASLCCDLAERFICVYEKMEKRELLD